MLVQPLSVPMMSQTSSGKKRALYLASHRVDRLCLCASCTFQPCTNITDSDVVVSNKFESDCNLYAVNIEFPYKRMNQEKANIKLPI